jgi:solute carrier family 25 S-adenosylmethionine transporter 26
VIKQNAQMLHGKSANTSTSMQAFRQLESTSTTRRLFRGYTALVARNLPFTALQFPVFEKLRAHIWRGRRRDGKTRGPQDLAETGVITAVSAASAGAVAAFITTPSDVVKTRMMLTAGENPNDGQDRVRRQGDRAEPKRGAWTVTKAVYADRGVRGFFRGGLFRSGWTALGSGLYLGTYDVAKVWLKRKRPDMDDEAGL